MSGVATPSRSNATGVALWSLLLLLCTPFAVRTALAGETTLPEVGPQPALEQLQRQHLVAVHFVDNRAIDQQELQEVVAEWLGQPLTATLLEEIRLAVTDHYHERGYPTSAAWLPDQTIEGGVVELVVVEGRLRELEIDGAGRLDEGYLTARLWPDPAAPLHGPSLQARFRRLLDDPLIRRLDGVLQPIPGDPAGSRLKLAVERSRPWSLRLQLDNQRPPGIGSEQLEMAATLHNLSGFGDRLDLTLGHGDGGNDGDLEWSMPLNAAGATLSLGMTAATSSVVEEPLDTLDVSSRYRGQRLSLRWPLFEQLEQLPAASRWAVGARLDRRRQQSWLLGEPFPFGAGDEEDGSITLSALRLWGEWTWRNTDRQLASRLTLNHGLGAWGATRWRDDRPDSDFDSLQWQLLFQQTIGQESLAHWLARFTLQRAADPLPGLERMAIGGASTLRGVRENSLVRDNGALINLELQRALWQGGEQRLDGLLFLDAGVGWHHRRRSERQRIATAGIGLKWQGSLGERLTIYWGHPIDPPAEELSGDLQDRGVHFAIAWEP